MRIYVISPVQTSTPENLARVKTYIEKMEFEGNAMFWPLRDVDQTLPLEKIAEIEIFQIRIADRVDIFWNKESKGSHFDLGVSIALDKPLRLVESFLPDTPNAKTYEKVINHLEALQREQKPQNYDSPRH
jgi:nucleoside 2-deoxyribosyltransferase